MARKDIQIADQLERRKNWKRPLVDPAAATFLYRMRDAPREASLLDVYEFLVVERLKGAEQGQSQAHHGGIMDVNDVDVWDTAVREPQEEVGYNLDPNRDLTYIGSLGPAIYRSEMAVVRDNHFEQLRLHITDIEAEPTVGFTLSLFIADVSRKKVVTTPDGEVSAGEWLSIREIVELFGKPDERGYSQFNYFQYLRLAYLFLRGNRVIGLMRAASAPGIYLL